MFSITINLSPDCFPPTSAPIDIDRTIEAISDRLTRAFPQDDFTVDLRHDLRPGIAMELSDLRRTYTQTVLEGAEERKREVEEVLAKIPPVLSRFAA